MILVFNFSMVCYENIIYDFLLYIMNMDIVRGGEREISLVLSNSVAAATELDFDSSKR